MERLGQTIAFNGAADRVATPDSYAVIFRDQIDGSCPPVPKVIANEGNPEF